MIDRRALILASALTPFAAVGTRAEDQFIYRVGGAVTQENFAGLGAFMMNSIDQFVGLKLVAPAGQSGELFAEETDGVLSIWRQGGDANLAFSSGYKKTDDKYYLDGFYRVTYGGMHQGINGIGLAPARTMDIENTGKPVKDLDIGRLRP